MIFCIFHKICCEQDVRHDPLCYEVYGLDDYIALTCCFMLNAKCLSPVRQSDELIYWAVEV